MILLYITVLLFIVASAYSILSIHKDIPRYVSTTKILMCSILLLLLVIGYPTPVFIAGVYKIHLFLFFYLIILFLTILTLYMGISQWNADYRSLSAILIPLTTIVAITALFFYNSPRFMVIDPNNSIMVIHIVLALLGEVLFFVAFASSGLYIIVSWQLQKKSSMEFINRFPSLTVLSKLTQFSLSRSLFFFTAGIILGIIMLFQFYGNISFGSPKEILMYTAWAIIFILWLVSRSHITSNYYISIMTIVSFLILMIVFIASNVVITSGFHSFR
ncbi:MAG: cytochrome c biogenesis protein CcsA [Spirochaetota bacterium]